MQQFSDVGRDEYRVCERLVRDQHLQHQGWAAVVANLDDITRYGTPGLGMVHQGWVWYGTPGLGMIHQGWVWYTRAGQQSLLTWPFLHFYIFGKMKVRAI